MPSNPALRASETTPDEDSSMACEHGYDRDHCARCGVEARVLPTADAPPKPYPFGPSTATGTSIINDLDWTPTADAPTAEAMPASVEAMCKLLNTLGYSGLTNDSEADGLFWLSDHLPSLIAADADRQRDKLDAERWRYARQFFFTTQWHLSPATQIGFSSYLVPHVEGRSDATVEEVIDAARAARSPEGGPNG